MPALAEVGVVIPAGPGERAWEGLLPALSGFGDTVLASVAGDDAVASAAAAAGVRLAPADRGRPRQLNAGARAISSRWLWFLHADSRLDRAVPEAIAAAPDGSFVGYFDLAFHDGPPLMWLNAAGARFRSRLLGLPFGDQGLLLRRDLFERLGGFDEALTAAEDHAFVWTARRAGIPLRPLGATLRTSARRYAEHGWWRTTARHLMLTFTQARTFSRRTR